MIDIGVEVISIQNISDISIEIWTDAEEIFYRD